MLDVLGSGMEMLYCPISAGKGVTKGEAGGVGGVGEVVVEVQVAEVWVESIVGTA
mgnify:CR=1 FL=1